MVSCISDRSIQEAVISEQPDDAGSHPVRQVVDVAEEKQGAQNGALGDSGVDGCFFRCFAFYNDAHLSVSEESLYPRVEGSPDAVAVEFVEEEVVRHLVKRFAKIEDGDVGLMSLVDISAELVDGYC